VLGLQEALRGQLDEIRAALPAYGEVGVGRDDGAQAGEYAAILFRRDRLDLLASGDFWLSDTPDVPGSRSWGNTVVRICTWARFLDRASGRTFAVYDTHLDHESQPARERGAALILWRIAAARPGGPVIVTGDFNAGEDNPAVRAMTAAGFADSYRVVHPADSAVNTYHAFRGGTAGPKIDFVFVSPEWRVADAAIVRTARDGRYPSDHFPVTARLTLGAAARAP
jgi:endonuclease/exonuclease/phosphatase family metal-dependent hydrolase